MSFVVQPKNLNFSEILAWAHSNAGHVGSLKISSKELTDDILTTIINESPQIQELDVTGSSITRAGLEAITRLPSLSTLRLGANPTIKDEDYPLINKITSIKTLDLSKSNVKNEHLETIFKNCTNISEISLRKCDGVNDQTIQLIATAAKACKTLRLSQSPNFTNEGLKSLAQSHVEVLYLRRCSQLNDSGVENLSEVKTLKEVNLRQGKNLTDASLKSLSKLPQLEALYLHNSPHLTDDGLDPFIKAASALKTLSLYECPNITTKGLESLRDKKIEALDIRGCPKIDPNALGLPSETKIRVK